MADDDIQLEEDVPADADDGAEEQNRRAVHDINVEVYAVLGTASMQVSQLLKIGRGAIIELDTGVGDPVDILANQHRIARGEVVVVDDHLAVSLTKTMKSALSGPLFCARTVARRPWRRPRTHGKGRARAVITLYDLVGKDDRRFSPHCWRTKMALAHKGLEFETRPTRFTEIPAICGGGQKTVPVLEDGDVTVADSWAIANYLEQTYPDRPSLFGGQVPMTLFVQSWAASRLHPALIGLIVYDIYEHLDPADKDYFRETREKRFGRSLEEMQQGRDEALPAFRAALDPMRHTLHAHDYLGGEAPLYADYLVFGSLQWARTISPFRLLEEDDPVRDWFERCLDLHGGLGRAAPGYD